MASEFNILKNADKSDIAVVKFGKELMGGNDALIFISKLNELPPQKIKHVIADLSQVELINSAGLGMLVSGLTTLKKYEIGFYLCSLPEKVIRLLEMTHLNKVFKVYENEELTLSSLG